MGLPKVQRSGTLGIDFEKKFAVPEGDAIRAIE
jgi:hypothetical protein